jgi:hypothetical protein
VIQGGDTILITAALTIWVINITGGATVTVYAGMPITFNDTAGAGLMIDSAPASFGNFSSSGTAIAPVSMSSTSASPANPWSVMLAPVAGNDTRTLNFDYVIMTGNQWTLGDNTNILACNIPGANKPWMLNVPPLTREAITVEHDIDGRNYSRIYPRGSKAGTIQINGYFWWDNSDNMIVQKMMEGKARLSLFTRYVHLPKCRIVGKPSMPSKPGQLYVPFSITLIEDR